MNSTVRRSIKDTTDNKRRWRDKFQKECTDRMKNARQDIIDKKREDQWMQKILEKEWDRFKKENEESMRREGVYDVDNLIEESIQEEDPQSEFHLLQEQAELESALALYEESQRHMCINCHKAALSPSTLKNTPIALCPTCGFYATENCLADIDKAASVHAVNCQDGLMEYSLEPGTDNTVIAVCNVCDLWNIFYM